MLEKPTLDRKFWKGLTIGLPISLLLWWGIISLVLTLARVTTG